MSNLSTQKAERLYLIGEQVNNKHAESVRCFEDAIYAAKACGDLLHEAKQLAGHGHWLAWLEENFESTPRQAQKYMKLSLEWDQLLPMLAANTNSNSHLTIDGAMALLAEPKPAEVVEGELVEEPTPAPTPAPAPAPAPLAQVQKPGISEIPGFSGTPTPPAYRRDNPTGHNDHLSPPDIVRVATLSLGGRIDLDPCANSFAPGHTGAMTTYTKEQDGLSQPWSGTVYLNPPYKPEEFLGSKTSMEDWAIKLNMEFALGTVIAAVALVPTYNADGWWTHWAGRMSRLCLIKGRVRFLHPTGMPQESGAPFSSSLIYFGEEPEVFEAWARDLGQVFRGCE